MFSSNNPYQIFLYLDDGYLDKIRVYVNSIVPSTRDYVDMESICHPCSQAGERALEGLQDLPARSSGFLSDEEVKAVDLVEQFSAENGFESEIIDLANKGLITKMKFHLKGWKTPVITFKGETIKGLPTKEELEALLQKF